MDESKDYKDLIIWQKADLIFDMVCEDIKRWPNGKVTNSIAYQLLDCAGSISANIAEGYGRGIPGEFEQFLRYSGGSIAQTDNRLFKAKKQALITQQRYNQYTALLTEINKMAGSFMHKLRAQPRRKTW